MKITDLVQGTPEWLEWRSGFAMASEAPVIMGAAPSWASVKTWADLRATKAGLERSKSEWLEQAAERGKAEEAKARFMMFPEHEPVCVVHDDGVYAASLDGYREENGGSIVEIKCPQYGLKSKMYEQARNPGIYVERIPDHVWWQMVHQAYVVGESNATVLYLLIWPGIGCGR